MALNYRPMTVTSSNTLLDKFVKYLEGSILISDTQSDLSIRHFCLTSLDFIHGIHDTWVTVSQVMFSTQTFRTPSIYKWTTWTIGVRVYRTAKIEKRWNKRNSLAEIIVKWTVDKNRIRSLFVVEAAGVIAGPRSFIFTMDLKIVPEFPVSKLPRHQNGWKCLQDRRLLDYKKK